ncbi:MAG: hypothetical protein WC071_04495 [Victivallaceae bacterium]
MKLTFLLMQFSKKQPDDSQQHSVKFSAGHVEISTGTVLEFPFARFKQKLKFKPLEFKTFCFDPEKKALHEINGQN